MKSTYFGNYISNCTFTCFEILQFEFTSEYWQPDDQCYYSQFPNGILAGNIKANQMSFSTNLLGQILIMLCVVTSCSVSVNSSTLPPVISFKIVIILGVTMYTYIFSTIFEVMQCKWILNAYWILPILNNATSIMHQGFN